MLPKDSPMHQHAKTATHEGLPKRPFCFAWVFVRHSTWNCQRSDAATPSCVRQICLIRSLHGQSNSCQWSTVSRSFTCEKQVIFKLIWRFRSWKFNVMEIQNHFCATLLLFPLIARIHSVLRESVAQQNFLGGTRPPVRKLPCHSRNFPVWWKSQTIASLVCTYFSFTICFTRTSRAAKRWIASARSRKWWFPSQGHLFHKKNKNEFWNCHLAMLGRVAKPIFTSLCPG